MSRAHVRIRRGAAVGLIALVALGCIQRTAPAAQDEPLLENLMAVIVTGCTDDGSSGTVKNGSGATVDLFITGQFLDSAGLVLDDGIDSITGVRPNETANWEMTFLGRGDVARCRAEVSSAFRK